MTLDWSDAICIQMQNRKSAAYYIIHEYHKREVIQEYMVTFEN